MLTIKKMMNALTMEDFTQGQSFFIYLHAISLQLVHTLNEQKIKQK